MDLSVAGMRVLREVAERGSFTAAASALGYTQSAVSRQIAALESALGVGVFERQRTGVRLTPAGRAVLRHATVALDEIDAAVRAVRGRAPAGQTVRLGAYPSAGAVLLPRALAALRRTHPEIEVSTREASTPALVRAVRAGSLDLAVLASAPPFRAPDTETPELVVEVISESDLHVAVPANHPLALDDVIDVESLRGQRWIASPSGAGEVLLGVWPGLGGRPRVAHSTRDWLAKLQLVAAGCGITTVPLSMLPAMPEGIRVLPVRGGPRETRRVLVARLPGRRSVAPRIVQEALRATADAVEPR
ncbi:LysR family transcriptional regulator [Rugosimonospora africana]|uniref:LysR family transcriptional regulator n=1 Tax=Rugosimonospora africana TaxID=556532 RepID=A0A8J3QUE3_9ACTN|nr:LysR family transcriptional regulator [Rugosimonospora africana]GIH16192.1 LysR family transcriptional regulator [Rugosimonospora africana]